MSNFFSLTSGKRSLNFLIFSVVYIAIILASSSIPMFWDMSSFAQTSNLIFDHHFSELIINSTDNGAIPLYSYYLAILWAAFGKSLLISHLAVLPFTIGMIFQFNKLAGRFLDKRSVLLAFVFLLIEPTILTQILMAGYDIVSCFLFLVGLNKVLENKRFMIALSMIIIPLINLRGFTLVASLFLTDLYINSHRKTFFKDSFNILLAYLPSVIFLFAWMIYHYKVTGWYAISESRKRYHHLSGLEIIFRNMVYVAWKIADFGRIIPLLFIFILYFMNRKSNEAEGKKLIFIILFSILPYCFVFLPLSYPVSHRHFMITYIIGIIAFIYFVNLIKQKTGKAAILILTFLCLIAGNFFVYPERYGNGWDASLKGYSYFKMKEQLDDFIISKKIGPSSVGTKFPMDFDNYDCNLKGEHFAFNNLDDPSSHETSYVVQSNICNTFTPDELDELNTKWVLVKEFHSWPVYIKLFRNPEYQDEN